MKPMRVGLHLVALTALAVGLSSGFEESLGFWEDEGVAVVEYIRPGGTCSTPSPENANASAVHGWALPAGELTYKVVTGSLPSGVTATQFANVVQAAAQEWDDAIPGAPRLKDGGTVANDKEGTFNGVSSVKYGGQVPVGAIAVAWVRASGGVVQEFDIRAQQELQVGTK